MCLADDVKVLRNLVLVGGGHAQLRVLLDLARRELPHTRVVLITPHRLSTYTGMVPGVIAGQYRLRQAQIDVSRLAERARVSFLADRVVEIDPRAQRLKLRSGMGMPFDFLSLDIGSQPAHQERLFGPAAVVKPIEDAIVRIEDQLRRTTRRSPRFVVVGGGAGGVELAFAIAARLRSAGDGQVLICSRSTEPLSGRHPNTIRLVREALRRHRIEFLGGLSVGTVEPGKVAFGPDASIPADGIVWATGAAGHRLLRDSGLPIDDRGFLWVGDDLRSERFPQIFAAGDCVSLVSNPKLPKAGVYAVRQGPLLSANLRAVLSDRPLREYRPQTQTLALINTADGRAILSYGSRAAYGRAAWWLKSWIDRRWIWKHR